MWRVLNFMAGLIAGAIIGMGIVLLTAPQSGHETRSQFRTRVDGILEEGRKAYAQRRVELESRLVDLKGNQSS